MLPTLFYFTAAVHAVLVAYVVWRMSRRQAAAAADRVVFSESAIAAQTVTALDQIGAGEPKAEQPAGT
jgi:hypothetical protein